MQNLNILENININNLILTNKLYISKYHKSFENDYIYNNSKMYIYENNNNLIYIYYNNIRKEKTNSYLFHSNISNSQNSQNSQNKKIVKI